MNEEKSGKQDMDKEMLLRAILHADQGQLYEAEKMYQRAPDGCEKALDDHDVGSQYLQQRMLLEECDPISSWLALSSIWIESKDNRSFVLTPYPPLVRHSIPAVFGMAREYHRVSDCGQEVEIWRKKGWNSRRRAVPRKHTFTTLKAREYEFYQQQDLAGPREVRFSQKR